MSKKSGEIVYIAALTIRPTYSVLYNVRIDEMNPRKSTNNNPIKRSEGELSQKAAQRIRNVIYWLLLLSHKKRVYSKAEKKTFSFVLNFITLTLSDTQIHSDAYIIHHMLQPFLKWLNRNYSKLYVWKAETQTNGNIHFHITTNTFIHWKTIRAKWNSIQQKHGYLKKWTDGNIKADPNSTDIHSVKNEKETAKYMAKYMTKNEPDKRKIKGRLWGCSYFLSNCKILINQHDKEFEYCYAWLKYHSSIKELTYSTILMHPNLKYLSPKSLLRKKLSVIYNESKQHTNQQKFFTVPSFN